MVRVLVNHLTNLIKQHYNGAKIDKLSRDFFRTSSRKVVNSDKGKNGPLRLELVLLSILMFFLDLSSQEI